MDGKIGAHAGCAGAGRTPRPVKAAKKKVFKKKATKKKVAKKAAKKKAIKKKVKKKTKQDTTYVAIVLDDSASMRRLRQGAVDAFNALCEPIREQGSDYKTSYYVFGETVSRQWKEKKPKKLPLLTMNTYSAGQRSTCLLDAIGKSIEDFEAVDDPDAVFLVIVITDGLENSSRHYGRGGNDSRINLPRKVLAAQATDRWTFAISCPQGNADQLARSLKIPRGNFQEWDQTDQGIQGMGERTKSAISNFTQQRKSGVRSVKSFYEVNVGRKSAKKVARKLAPVANNRFRKLRTNASCSLRDFILSKNLTYSKGCVFYSLQKSETVQPYKEIVLENRSTGEMHSGPNVRKLLNIPEGRNGQVVPGNLGEWIVWVQSTSVNRKFLAKTDLLYDKTC
jgi:hypothetical protein